MFSQTPRLILRRFTADDLSTFLAYRNDPDVARYQGWDLPYTADQATRFFTGLEKTVPGTPGEWFQIALEHRETGELIGDCAFCTRSSGIQAQIGYTLARPFHQQGYGTEAVKGLLDYLFDSLSMHRISAYCDTRNEPSWKLLEKVGFRLEGHYVENYRDRGEWASEYHYALLQREWANGSTNF